MISNETGNHQQLLNYKWTNGVCWGSHIFNNSTSQPYACMNIVLKFEKFKLPSLLGTLETKKKLKLGISPNKKLRVSCELIITNVGWVFVEYQDQYSGKNSIFLELSNCCTLPHSKALMGRTFDTFHGGGKKNFLFSNLSVQFFLSPFDVSVSCWGREKHWKLFLDLWLYKCSSIFLRRRRVLELMVCFSPCGRRRSRVQTKVPLIRTFAYLLSLCDIVARMLCYFYFRTFWIPQKSSLCNRIFFTLMNGLVDDIQFANLSWSKGRCR